MLIWALLSSAVFVASNIFIRFYLTNVHWLALMWSRAIGTLCCLSLVVFFGISEEVTSRYFSEMASRPLLWTLTLVTGFLGIWGFIKSIKLLPLYVVIPFTTLNLVTVLVSHLVLSLDVQSGQLVGIVLGIVGLALLVMRRQSYNNKLGWYWLFLCVTSWGVAYPLSRPLIQSTSPLFFATVMECAVFLGSSVLLLFSTKNKQKYILTTLPKPGYYGWIVSLLVFGVICDAIAREVIPPISMLAFAGFSEIGVLVIGHFFFQEQLRWRQWLGASLTLFAMFLVLA